MSSTARVAWIDAWEGASTPSPYAYRRPQARTARPPARPVRYEERPVARPRPTSAANWAPAARERSAVRRSDWADASEWTGSVVHMSAERQVRRPSPEVSRETTRVPQAPAIADYDWDAAARRRPGRDEYERVILHTDRSVEARMSSTQYYGREATARRPDPLPEAPRRASQPRLRVVKHRVPRWRLRVLAGVFAFMFVGLMVIAPIITSSAVAGLESAVGQAETQQQQLAADTAALSSQISSLSSPQRVAEEAAQLGLVPANDVSYLASGDQMLASEGDTAVAGR